MISFCSLLGLEPEIYLIKKLVNLPLVLNYFDDDYDNLGGHFNISSDINSIISNGPNLVWPQKSFTFEEEKCTLYTNSNFPPSCGNSPIYVVHTQP